MEQLTEDQQRLVNDNHNLIYGFLHKYNLSIEDYYGLAAIGLCKAAMSFDPDRGLFTTYAYFIMYNEVKQHFRHITSKSAIPNGCLLSYDEIVSDAFDDTSKATYKDLADDPIDVADTAVFNDLLDHAVECTSERDMQVIKLIAEGYSQRSVADAVGVSQAQVSRILKTFRSRLK